MGTDEDGRITSDKAAQLLEHAQRVAEGRLLDVHANTWRYNQLVAQQRAILVERRNTLLRTATAREELAARAPERYEELVEEIGEERLETISRQIMLYHLDRGWADHQAYLSDIRESIHLRALGRQNPLDEFHRLAVDAFASLAADAIEAAQQTFETANVAQDEQGLDLSKLAQADLDVDVHDSRQPAVGRLHVRTEPARGVPLGSSHGAASRGDPVWEPVTDPQRAQRAAARPRPGLHLPAGRPLPTGGRSRC